jgi:ATP-dependent DNA helicase RecQ
VIPSVVDEPVDPELFAALRKTRAALAEEHGGVPHYVIFPDETLKAFARIRPQSVDAARRIRGVGEIKAERYVPAFLDAIREFGRESGPQVQPTD